MLARWVLQKQRSTGQRLRIHLAVSSPMVRSDADREHPQVAGEDYSPEVGLHPEMCRWFPTRDPSRDTPLQRSAGWNRLRLRDLEIGADPAGEEIVHFALPRDGRGFESRTIDVHGMILPLANSQP